VSTTHWLLLGLLTPFDQPNSALQLIDNKQAVIYGAREDHLKVIKSSWGFYLVKNLGLVLQWLIQVNL